MGNPDKSRTASVVRQVDAVSFMEGPEHCREYLRNPDMWFGTSTLQVGQTGALDPGHPRSWEVFYVASGRALVNDGTMHHEMNMGDALLIPPGVPHTITNIGSEPTVVVWAGGPGETSAAADTGEGARA